MTQQKKSPIVCDPTTGVCELPGVEGEVKEVQVMPAEKPVRIVYFTDPICSACWGIEPQLRKLMLTHGDYIDVDYLMGGLLEDWSYRGDGISKPADVAHHWEEASLYYQMPIDGDVWLENPLHSSYPPSIAFKAAQMQHKEKAVVFMRKLREYLFLDKRNITDWDVMCDAGIEAKLNVFRLEADYEGGEAKRLFEEDLGYGRQLGVRGFPTLFFTDGAHNQLVLYGFRSYEAFERAVLQLYPDAKKKPVDTSDPLALFDHYPTLAPKEYAVIADIPMSEAVRRLDALVAEGKLTKKTIKTGAMYQKCVILPKIDM